MSDHPRQIARRFAATLSHLRDAHGLEYVPAGSAPSAAPQAEPPSTTTTVDAKAAMRRQASSWSSGTKLEYLRRQNIGDCRRCGLCHSRQNIVFGVGDPEADVMFVGEAPGADEDRQGEPFVGRAGRRLDVWIGELGLQREDVYIANVLKCRPPGNRDPKPDEVDKCSPFLQAQIRAIDPKVIVALGRHAGMLLSRREDMSLRVMRTSQLTYDAGNDLKIPLVATYHPAYVLRQEGADNERAPVTDTVMQDLRRALAIAGVKSNSSDEK